MLLNILVNKQIVGCDAGLTCVEALAPRNAASYDIELGTLVYDARTLASKLKNYGG